MTKKIVEMEETDFYAYVTGLNVILEQYKAIAMIQQKIIEQINKKYLIKINNSKSTKEKIRDVVKDLNNSNRTKLTLDVIKCLEAIDKIKIIVGE